MNEKRKQPDKDDDEVDEVDEGGQRLHFEPCDRILFVHHDSNRIFEGSVSDVDRRYTHVSINVPIKDARRSKRISVRLNVYRHFKQFELISLFRPTIPQLHAPPGFYLNHSTTDLWLDLDDIIEIVAQGSHVQHQQDTFDPQIFKAKVSSVNEITCQIIPITNKTTPSTINSSEDKVEPTTNKTTRSTSHSSEDKMEHTTNKTTQSTNKSSEDKGEPTTNKTTLSASHSSQDEVEGKGIVIIERLVGFGK